jgi:hypothetical protein
MEIIIDGKAADITLESEKNLGDFLTGIEQWFEGGGRRLREISVDGRDIDADSLAGCMDQNLQDIKTIAIKTICWPELAVDALIYTLEDIAAWKEASLEEKGVLRERWKESAAAHFLEEHIRDIFTGVEKTLEGELSPEASKGLIEERLREITAPYGELENMGSLVTAVAGRLENLPLDIQTGKDGQAAETIQLFSHIGEKLFRLLYMLKSGGLIPENLTIDSLSIQNFIEEFGVALKELTAAYEAKDAVLVGDLAEYEFAPRLISLYTTLKKTIIIQEQP